MAAPPCHCEERSDAAVSMKAACTLNWDEPASSLRSAQ
jgi:hypothetical protein